ncbi:MAG: sigma 54-interacting transcriptional regulator [Firmicutes bacterium]|nr:sigma 54-interacting transcriptional regulator [Bacillota bacterium]
MNLSIDDVKSVWKCFRKNENNNFELPLVSNVIKASWERSAKYGVNPYLKYAPVVLTPHELALRKEHSSELITHSLPTMKKLHDFVMGTGFVVTLTDDEGYIIEMFGDEEAMKFTQPGKFIVGAKWSEDVMGTNAIGVALVEKRPIQVFGYEHYSLCAFNTTCSAAPICDPNGKIIGVLDLTGPFDRASNHTLGMVVAAVNAIENQIVLQRAFDASELANLHKTIIMESMSDGVLVVDKNGYVTHLNRAASQLLRLDPSKSIGCNLASLFGSKDNKNDYFMDLLRRGVNINDETVTINVGSEKVKCNISCRPLVLSNGTSNGAVAILRENKRITRLVTRTIGAHAKMCFDHIVGKNTALVQAIQLGKAAAMSPSNVLLLGESGTGKDLFAQAIHNASARRAQPFVAINCAAIPRELIASELFGYEEGAFTGARKGGNPGKFELADQGTIFLDEIGEMPLDLQASLLRVLEERAIVRLGGKETIPVNVRVIAATNKNLRREIEKGNFRSDLYYRLNVIMIEIPPLRARKDDLELLSMYFLRKINERLGRQVEEIKPEVMEIFQRYDWPGNIRELQNVIERAVHVTVGTAITLNDIPMEIVEVGGKFNAVNQDSMSSISTSGRQLVRHMEEQLIRSYLQKFGSKARVARELGMARSSLYRKLEEYGIK